MHHHRTISVFYCIIGYIKKKEKVHHIYFGKNNTYIFFLLFSYLFLFLSIKVTRYIVKLVQLKMAVLLGLHVFFMPIYAKKCTYKSKYWMIYTNEVKQKRVSSCNRTYALYIFYLMLFSESMYKLTRCKWPQQSYCRLCGLWLRYRGRRTA